jgi:hypothetical protein
MDMGIPKRPGILISLKQVAKEKVVIILKSPKNVKQFLEGIQ